MLNPMKVDHSFILKTTFWKEQDHREVITHTLIPTDILNKGALPYSYWTNDRKHSQIWRSIGTQQEIQDLFPFSLATKHAIVQDQICTVRLAEYPRIQIQEEKKLLHTSHGVFKGIHHPLQLISYVAVCAKQQCFSVIVATAGSRETEPFGWTGFRQCR